MIPMHRISNKYLMWPNKWDAKWERLKWSTIGFFTNTRLPGLGKTMAPGGARRKMCTIERRKTNLKPKGAFIKSGLCGKRTRPIRKKIFPSAHRNFHPHLRTDAESSGEVAERRSQIQETDASMRDTRTIGARATAGGIRKISSVFKNRKGSGLLLKTRPQNKSGLSPWRSVIFKHPTHISTVTTVIITVPIFLICFLLFKINLLIFQKHRKKSARAL